MINHHWLRIRESRTQIFNCGVSTCSHYRIYVRKCQAKISNSSYVAALFQCRSCPGVSPQRCLAPILAKSYPIFWRVWTCQAAQPHITIPASENKKHRKTLIFRQDSSCLKISLLRCLVAQWCCITVSACAIWVRGLFSCDDLVCSDYRTYIRNCQDAFSNIS